MAAKKKTTAPAATKTGVELAPQKTAPKASKPSIQDKLQEAQVISQMPKRSDITLPPDTVVNAVPSVNLPENFWSGVNAQAMVNQFNTQYNNPVTTQTELASLGETISGDPDTGTTLFKAALKSIGLSDSLVNSSIDFYKAVSKDGITNPEDQTQIFFYNKTYTNQFGQKFDSPFYNAYGKFREFAGPEYTEPAAIVGYVDGIKNIINKNGFNKKFANDDAIEKYMKNNVDVAVLSQRANDAIAASLTTDTQYVESLKQQGYINGAEDLKDFYMDPAIGEETLQQRKISGIIGAEAIRRNTPETPTLKTLGEGSKSLIQQAAARYRALGYTDAKARQEAEKAYGEVAASLEQTTKLSGIYEGRLPEQKNLTEAGRVGEIQTELEKENLLGLASARRKKLYEMNIGSFSGSSGTAGAASFARQIQI